MRVAFHFAADRFGGVYGFPTTTLLFRALLKCVPTQRREVFIRHGDVLWSNSIRTTEDLIRLGLEMVKSSRPIWTTCSGDALADALLNTRIWILAVEGLTAIDAQCVDLRLRQTVGYLGAVEVHLANRVHWVVYDRQLVAAYRIVGEELRLLASSEHLDPEGREPGRIREWAETKLFQQVDWEDIGLRDTIFDDLSSFARAERVAAIEDQLGTSLGPVVGVVLMRLQSLDPRLSDSLHAALTALAQADSDEQVAQAALSCRRFLERLADALCPPRPTHSGERKLGEKEYRNRLWAYIEETLQVDERPKVVTVFEELGRRLESIDKKANTHIHDSGGTAADANRLILALTVWTYDVLILAAPLKAARIDPHRDAVDRFVKALLTNRSGGAHE